MQSKEYWANTSPQNILVVDDEQPIREFVAEALMALGHEVRTAADGEDAMLKLQQSHFNVVITDMVMPRMDGMQLIRYLTEHQNAIDIIAITGQAMIYKYTDVVAAGAADFITKPFTFNELEAKLNRLIRERALRDELERLAVRDALTGLFNRRVFQNMVRKESIRAIRYQHPLYLFFLDVDRFKQYNDKNGHQAGDSLLVRFAAMLKGIIREEVDSAFRYGGDEFTVLLPYLPSESAVMVAERIRGQYNGLKLEPTSLSIGIARFRDQSDSIDHDIEDMIHRADSALYHAKHGLGRDRVYVDLDSLD